MDFKKEFKRVIASGLVSGVVSEDLIAFAEKELGVSFPVQYVEFLQEYGSLLLNGVDIYGILNTKSLDEPPLFSSIVNETKLRREVDSYFSENKHCIPIASDGYSKKFFLDTSVSPKTCIRSFDFGIEKYECSDIYEFIIRFEEFCGFKQ